MGIEQNQTETGAVSELEERAACLVNPASGIANDYLNHFNEVLLLIENLPTLLPEMLDELLEWRPVTYREYFAKSLLPGSARALQIYEGLDDGFRREFESIIDGVNAMATASIDVISAHRSPDGELDPSRVSELLRERLLRHSQRAEPRVRSRQQRPGKGSRDPAGHG